MNLKMADKSPEQEKIEKRRLVSACSLLLSGYHRKLLFHFGLGK